MYIIISLQFFFLNLTYENSYHYLTINSIDPKRPNRGYEFAEFRLNKRAMCVLYNIPKKNNEYINR